MKSHAVTIAAAILAVAFLTPAAHAETSDITEVALMMIGDQKCSAFKLKYTSRRVYDMTIRQLLDHEETKASMMTIVFMEQQKFRKAFKINPKAACDTVRQIAERNGDAQ